MDDKLYNLFYRVIYFENTHFKNYSAEEIIKGTCDWYAEIEDYDSVNYLLKADPDAVIESFTEALNDYIKYIKEVSPLIIKPTLLSEAIKIAKNTDTVFNTVSKYLDITAVKQGTKIYDYIHKELATHPERFEAIINKPEAMATFIEQVAKKTKSKIIEG